MTFHRCVHVCYMWHVDLAVSLSEKIVLSLLLDSMYVYSFCFAHKQTLASRDLQGNTMPCLAMLCGAPRCCAPFDETA